MRKSNTRRLGKWLYDKVNTPEYRAGKVSGKKHPKRQVIFDALADEIGRAEIIRQVSEMEDRGIIEVKWTSVNTDFREITFSMENVGMLCEYLKIDNPINELMNYKRIFMVYKNVAKADWLLRYYDNLIQNYFENGKIPSEAKDENILKILNAISALENDVWKRKFSADILGDSKKFSKYENSILTVLKKNSDRIAHEIDRDELSNDQILAEHHIMTYSQTLQCKGDIRYVIKSDDETCEISTHNMFYGTIINAQSLTNTVSVSIKGVKKIVTIENKANYEDMKYNPEILYIFAHGFFSPKERVFLRKMLSSVDDSVEFYHWGDLDYGGIRIFLFIKNHVFSKVKPLYMNKIKYYEAVNNGIGIKISEEKRKKLCSMEAEELEELKQCILENGLEIEQENFM